MTVLSMGAYPVVNISHGIHCFWQQQMTYPPLLLEHNAWRLVRFRGIAEDGNDTHAVNVGAGRTRETFARLPCSLNAVGVGVCSSVSC